MSVDLLLPWKWPEARWCGAVDRMRTVVAWSFDREFWNRTLVRIPYLDQTLLN
jgi:hypothetical protein